MAAEPTPRPTTNRPTAICATVKAAAWTTEPVRNSAQPAYMPNLRPYLSAGRPAIRAPTRAPPDVRDVTISCSLVESSWPRSLPSVTSTAEMTPVS